MNVQLQRLTEFVERVRQCSIGMPNDSQWVKMTQVIHQAEIDIVVLQTRDNRMFDNFDGQSKGT